MIKMINLAIIGISAAFIIMIIAYLRKSVILLMISGFLLIIFGFMLLSTGETILSEIITNKVNDSYTQIENVYDYQRDKFTIAFSFISIILGFLALIHSLILTFGGRNG